jgi:(2Fe-2S) ferredoxin
MSSFAERRSQALANWDRLEASEIPRIYVGTASCGRAAGALDVLAAARETLADNGLEARLVQVGCIGPCYLEPLLDVALPGRPRVSYGNVTPAKAKRIVESCLVHGDLQPKLAAGYLGTARDPP